MYRRGMRGHTTPRREDETNFHKKPVADYHYVLIATQGVYGVNVSLLLPPLGVRGCNRENQSSTIFRKGQRTPHYVILITTPRILDLVSYFDSATLQGGRLA